MEDGFPLFDPNNEEERQEQKLKEYFGSFSENARLRLLSKTIVRPTSVYDILYPKAREVLLSKNITFNTDLEESSKMIRDGLMSKLITNETNLDKKSEDFRNSLLARNKITSDKNDLNIKGDEFRKNLISKNIEKNSNIEQESTEIRNSNVAKNHNNASSEVNIEKNNSVFRDNQLSKNVSKKQDLLSDSEIYRNQFRKNDIHKNVSTDTDLEKDSEAFRKNNIIKNNENHKNINDISEAKRQSELAKNNKKSVGNLENDSEVFRKDDLSKNTPKNSNLTEDSKVFREEDLSKNIANETDIDNVSESFRKNNTSKNSDKKSDLDKDSEVYRKNNESSNSKESSLKLDEIGDKKREDSLSKNKPKNTKLEEDSVSFRKGDLSLNAPNNSDLENDSVEFRKGDLSLNTLKKSDLENDSVVFRKGDLSLNIPKNTDLENDSITFRKGSISLNTTSDSNLEVDSVPFRIGDISLNTPKNTDLENDSISFRVGDTSLNVPNNSDLETDSVPFRTGDLSLNTPNNTDLEVDSVPFRVGDLSLNTPNNSDLETDSVAFRVGDLSLNTPNNTDLEVDSVPFRVIDLSLNVPNNTNLETDSTPFLFNNLSANVPNNSDLEADSVAFRAGDLSANIPSNSDLEADSVAFRAGDLSANIPSNSNINLDSIDFRNNNLSSNIPHVTNLENDSNSFLKDALSKNAGSGLIGVNVFGAGTSSFLGISKVATQGVLIRQLLLSKNNNKGVPVELIDSSYVPMQMNIKKNKWQPFENEYNASTSPSLGGITQGAINSDLANFSLLGGFKSPIEKFAVDTKTYNINQSAAIQYNYGISNANDFSNGEKKYRISDALYSVNSLNKKGGDFINSTSSVETAILYKDGVVTSAIRDYNQSRNIFNLHGIQSGNLDSLGVLTSVNEEGFQDLIEKTVGSLKGNNSIGSQTRTNTTPADVAIKNSGAYYPGGDTDLMKPGAVDAPLGSAESMMAKTVIGNPYDNEDFLLGKRGVRHIVNTIKNSSSPLAANFDPQNSNKYVLGANKDGTTRVSRQKFTIANPYAPKGAQKLMFFIKNYSSGEQFFFPPYITSISNSESASWNTTNFLGRPEAVYTYNNSTRKASISFFVLTDYSQKVEIGTDWKNDSMDKITQNISRHFTDGNNADNASSKLADKKKEERIEKIKEELAEISEKESSLSNPTVVISQSKSEITLAPGDDISVSDAVIQADKDKNATVPNDNNADKAELSLRKENLQKELSKLNETETHLKSDYSESNVVGNNVYNIGLDTIERNDSEIVTKASETADRIDTMKKSLMFQPSFFSGDKIDFVRRVDFLSKLTRPAANDSQSNTGFSFTKPPVCHIHLGTWWNHDIIVNNVDFDYADAPWTLDGDGGNVQPMWTKVTIAFNIIGPYKAVNARPPLSTDEGGMYSPRTS